jgi:hypothetical protein
MNTTRFLMSLDGLLVAAFNKPGGKFYSVHSHPENAENSMRYILATLPKFLITTYKKRYPTSVMLSNESVIEFLVANPDNTRGFRVDGVFVENIDTTTKEILMSLITMIRE